MAVKSAARASLAQCIAHLNPCGDAVEWLDGHSSPSKAWAACERGDWLLWLLGTQAGPPESDGRKKLVLCACECARLALPHKKDQRVLACIETAERWARSEATLRQLQEARRAAAAADAAAYAADAAAYAAYAAYAAVVAVVADAARKRLLAQCADIVRKHYPKPPTIRSL